MIRQLDVLQCTKKTSISICGGYVAIRQYNRLVNALHLNGGTSGETGKVECGKANYCNPMNEMIKLGRRGCDAR